MWGAYLEAGVIFCLEPVPVLLLGTLQHANGDM
jgi:hypothetical protein